MWRAPWTDLAILHYPGQAKPWKYVHLFSRAGLLRLVARYRQEGHELDKLLLLYNIDAATARANARCLCQTFGEIIDVRIPDPVALVPPHMLAIVQFADAAAASKASDVLDGTTLCGRALSAGLIAVEAFRQKRRFTTMFGKNATSTFQRWWDLFEGHSVDGVNLKHLRD